jgi:hypothetical protein
MSYELIAIILFAITQMAGLLYLHHEVQAQLRRNLALETQFQKWDAEQTGNIVQWLDQILEMLRTHQL